MHNTLEQRSNLRQSQMVSVGYGKIKISKLNRHRDTRWCTLMSCLKWVYERLYDSKYFKSLQKQIHLLTINTHRLSLFAKKNANDATVDRSRLKRYCLSVTSFQTCWNYSISSRKLRDNLGSVFWSFGEKLWRHQ